LRPPKDINYTELHLGKTLFLGRREFLKRCNTTSKSVGKAVQKCAKSSEGCQRIPSNLPALHVILYGLHKMTSGSVLDPDPELINTQSLNFAKPKLFFKNISHNEATSTYIHVHIPFNFTTGFQQKSYR
jgi:hypothetical protein